MIPVHGINPTLNEVAMAPHRPALRATTWVTLGALLSLIVVFGALLLLAWGNV